jgi:hypothetical protein
MYKREVLPGLPAYSKKWLLKVKKKPQAASRIKMNFNMNMK